MSFNLYGGSMEDFFVLIVSTIIEIFGELLVELILGGVADLSVRGVRKLYKETRSIPRTLVVVQYFLFGAILGVVSVFLLPHQIAPHTRFHGINLLMSPAIVGWIFSLIGLSNRRRGRQTVRIESFGYGFVFAFGIAIVRFFFIQ